MRNLRLLTFVTSIALTLAPSTSHATELIPLLILEHVKDGETASTLSLMATEIDPNKRSGDDQYELWLDGQPIKDHDLKLAALAHARRAFAYDNFTDGIIEGERIVACRMAGPAVGNVLSVRYLTYAENEIVSDEMRPVMTDPENCLFTRLVHPQKRPSEVAAAKALARMQGWRDILTPLQ